MEDKEKNIIAFVTKLNDRNIQRQRENGFTIYAILAGIIYTSIYLVENANVLFNKGDLFTNNLFLFVTLINFAPIIFYVWSFLGLIYGESKMLRVQPKLFNKYQHYTILPAYLFIFLLTVINCIAYYMLDKRNISNGFLLPFIGYYSILFIFGIYKSIRLYKTEKNNPHALRVNNLSDKTRGEIWTNAVYMIIFSILNVLFLRVIIDSEINVQFLVTLKYSFYFLGFLFLSVLLSETIKQRNKDRWLEDLEKDIVMEGIKYEDIVTRLEKEYFGYKVEK